MNPNMQKAMALRWSDPEQAAKMREGLKQATEASRKMTPEEKSLASKRGRRSRRRA